MAEINATERKRPSRTIKPTDEGLPVETKEAADDHVMTKQLITRPNLQDEVSFLRLPELKSVTGLSKSSLYALNGRRVFLRPFNSDRERSPG
jgi:hypothetical protein